MLDVLLIALVIGFFLVADLFVRGCARILDRGPRRHSGGPAMTAADVVFFVIIAALLAYLAWALIAPEDLQ